jgi:D-psicose/D-tagatose/L-ribulose 3-epimerase
MRLAISNIAWDIVEDEQVVSLLRQHRIDAIDVAPGKYFPDPLHATDEDISRVKAWWADRGVEITGMQALLFGTTGLNVFGAAQVQDTMLAHLEAVCRIGAGLGAPRLVFGSPKNRDRSGLTDEETLQTAVQFFRRLGDVAQAAGVFICLEPNPPCYGANFMTTSTETARIVQEVSHPAIKMQLDTGALTINGEDVTTVLPACAHLIGHVHASEPDLLPLGDGATDHGAVYSALQQYLPTHLVSIEMLATREEPHLAAIDRALNNAIRSYRPDARVDQ